jgi:hypothetical protein
MKASCAWTLEGTHGIRTGRIGFLAGRKKKQERLSPECAGSAEIADGDQSRKEGRRKGRRLGRAREELAV